MHFVMVAKQRPVLILACPQPDDAWALMFVAPLTLQIRGICGEVDIGKPPWLTKASAVNVEGLASINHHDLVHKLGTLSGPFLKAVKDALRDLLDL